MGAPNDTRARASLAGENASPWLALGLGATGAGLAVLATALFVSSIAVADASSTATPPAPAVTGTPASTTERPQASASAASVASAEPAAKRDGCPPRIVGFGFGAATIEGEGGPSVDALAAWLVRHPAASVIIHGHADALGSDAGNLALSRQRANVIANRLGSGGVDRTRMTVRGFGSYQPVEGAPEEAASNRRAVIYVKGAGTACPEDDR